MGPQVTSCSALQRCVGPPEDGDSDGEERDDEQPVIVVLKKGDLDADEVARLGGDSSKDTSAGTTGDQTQSLKMSHNMVEIICGR